MRSAWKRTQRTVSALKALVFHCDFYALRGTQIPGLGAWVRFLGMRAPSEGRVGSAGACPTMAYPSRAFQGPPWLSPEGGGGEEGRAQMPKQGK